MAQVWGSSKCFSSYWAVSHILGSGSPLSDVFLKVQSVSKYFVSLRYMFAEIASIHPHFADFQSKMPMGSIRYIPSPVDGMQPCIHVGPTRGTPMYVQA